jgi:LPXTG-motif cell wall-anchored protein
LSVGDRLTATIVTEKPPKIMTEQQVQATIHPGAPAAAAAPKTSAPAASTTRSAGAPPPATGTAAAKTGTGATGTGEKKTLPKTASQLPLIGATGAVCLAIAAALAVRRRRSA